MKNKLFRNKLKLLLLTTIAIHQGTSNQIYAQSASWDGITVPIYGTDNCGFGVNALNNTGTGPGNTATGSPSLRNNSSGEFNTAAGRFSLYHNYGGNQNVALGSYSMAGGNPGCSGCVQNLNTAVGNRAMSANVDGNKNTAVGYRAFENNTNASSMNSSHENTVVGHRAMPYNNNLTSIGNNYNTIHGHYAGAGLAEAEETSAFGSLALAGDGSSTMGFGSAAFGYKAMYKAGGSGLNMWQPYNSYNTAFGANTMTDMFNTVMSVASFSVVGRGNTAIGESVLTQVGGGQYNTAVGQGLLPNLRGWVEVFSTSPPPPIDWGSYNIAMGHTAMEQSTGARSSIAIGAVLANIQYPLFNTVIGNGVFNNLINSSTTTVNNTAYNTYVGSSGFANATSGKQLTGIGYGVDVIGGNWNNSTGIGYMAQIYSDTMVKIGNVNLIKAVTQTNWQFSSDGRFKYDVREDEVKGIEFIKLLRPVNYNYDKMADINFTLPYVNDALKEEYKNHADLSDKDFRHTGFIAQEVEAAAKEAGFENNNIVDVPKRDHEKYGLAYNNMVMPLIKAIQQQQVILKDNHALNEKLNKEYKRLLESGELANTFNYDESNADVMIIVESDKIICSGKNVEKAEFLIYKLNGNVVEKLTIPASETNNEIALSKKLENGIYLYAMISGGTIIKSDKVLIDVKL